MPKPSYHELLRRPEWQKRREEILERDNFQCRQCDARECPLQIHHRYYLRGKDPWDYPDDALLTVCKGCHAELGLQDDELRFLIGQLDEGEIERLIGGARRMLWLRGTCDVEGLLEGFWRDRSESLNR